MGFIMMLIMEGIDLIIVAVKLFCSAVWKAFKAITHFLLFLLKPVYRFMFKAIPITTVILSVGFGILVVGFIWSLVSDNIEINNSNTVNIVEESQENEKNGIVSGFVDRSLARLDKFTLANEKFWSGFSISGSFIGFVLIIILIALLPIFCCVFFIVSTMAFLVEIMPLSLILDIVRNIYISTKQQIGIKNMFIEWMDYAREL